jgi:cation transport ATPase
MMTSLTSFLRAWVGEEEYHDAWHKQAQNRSFPLSFWGRLIIAAAGLCFFMWQQTIEPSHWWGSDTFATLVLVLTASQAAGPFVYLLSKGTTRLFLTKHYLETLREGRFYVTTKSTVGILLMTSLSVLAVYGSLGTRWYMKPLVFVLTVPVAWFWVFLPTLNWAGVRWNGLRRKSAKGK